MTDIFLITAYCLLTSGCGASGERTTSGTHPVAMITAACDPRALPLGSTFTFDGSHSTWICEDTGPAVNGQHVDLFFGYGKEQKKLADDWGRRWRRLRVLSRPDVQTKIPPEDANHSE